MVGNEGRGKWLGTARRKRRNGRKKKEIKGKEREMGKTGELPALICPPLGPPLSLVASRQPAKGRRIDRLMEDIGQR